MSILEQAVAELIIKATSAAEAAGKFAIEQLPDIAQQYVLYIGVSSTIKALLCLPLVFLFLWGVKKQSEWVSKWKPTFSYDSNDRGLTFIATSLLAVFGGIPLTMFFLRNIDNAMLAFLAPKILLIQWATILVK